MIATLISPIAIAAPILYRYIGKERTIDQPSTKQFRKKLRRLTLEVINSDGFYVCCKGSDGNYYDWIPLDQLEPVSDQGGAS